MAVQDYELHSAPEIGTSQGGDKIALGGFSGLLFQGRDESSGNLRFMSHPDRGPNADLTDLNSDGVKERPFVIPNYQLEMVQFELSPQQKTLRVSDRTLLSVGGGALTGIPFGAKPMPKGITTEQPVDLKGNVLPFNQTGLDPEGIALDSKGNYWMVEEYGPSILKLSSKGKQLNRFIPKGVGKAIEGKEVLPSYYAKRKMNRGFEGIAIEGNQLFAFLQSPLPLKKKGKLIRVLVFNMDSEKTVAEYLYVLESHKANKIGDAAGIGDMRFAVVEQNSKMGKKARRKVFLTDFSKATNVLQPDLAFVPWENMTSEEFAAKGIKTGTKRMLINLVKHGFRYRTKVEGLALLSPSELAIINDNDFGLAGKFNPVTGKLIVEEGKVEKTRLTIFRFNRKI